jgi:putative ABC transport system permease protein
VIWQGWKLVAIGLGAGMMASLMLVRVTTAMLYGVGPFDWVTWVAVTLLFIAVALPACWLPALRATKVDPMKALRSE